LRRTLIASAILSCTTASAWTTEWRDVRITVDNAVTAGAAMRVEGAAELR